MSCGTIFAGETWKGPESNTRMASQKRHCLKSVLKHRQVKCMEWGTSQTPLTAAFIKVSNTRDLLC